MHLRILGEYELDPANYISAPSLAWDAMLLRTKVEIEQISDLKILHIIERHKKRRMYWHTSFLICIKASTKFH